MFRFNVNPDSEIPIYRQLVDQINASIRSGAIPTGTQLPTVREMAQQLHLSCGTVKRVYDRLQEMGDIEMTRRRGTFVKYVRADKDSRKIQAMAAIDKMIRQLSELNFSPAEIEIFLNLKMREWGLKWSGIRVALVMDYAELGAALEKQLSQIGNVRMSICSLKQLREYPYSIDEQSDVILASVEDAPKISSVLPDGSKLVRVAFALETACVFELSKWTGRRIGAVSADGAFAELVRSCMPGEEIVPCVSGREAQELDCVVAARDYPLDDELAQMEAAGRLVRFDYGIDQGSMLYLQERIGRIREERQLRPGSLSF